VGEGDQQANRYLIFALLLAVTVLAVYWPVGRYDFISFDDPQFITQNPIVSSGLNWQSFCYALSASIADNWHPVTTLSHILDCELFGTSPGLMHLVNAAFHAANAVLLFLVLRRMTGATWRSAIVAALFALHPLRVESVAWIAERKDVLGGFFFLLTLWAYVGYVEATRAKAAEPQQEGPARRSQPTSVLTRSPGYHFALTLLCFVLGLMSKPTLVTLPFVLLLLDVWPLNRLQRSGSRNGEATSAALGLRGSNLVQLTWEKLPFFVLSALCCWITLRVQKEGMINLSLADLVSNAAVSYLQYIGKTFWPVRLAVLYPHPALHYPHSETWPGWQIWLAALALVAISAFCVCQLRRRPFLAVGWFWYLGMLVPMIGLVQVGEKAIADRYTYLSLIGFTISLVWFASELWQRGRIVKILLGTLTGAALLACLAVTHAQLKHWQNSITLFEHAVAVTPDNPIAQCNLGAALDFQGDAAAAAVRYRVAIAINPRDQEAHFNLGRHLKAQGHWPEAAREFLAVTRLRPDGYLPRLALVECLSHSGRTREAAGQMEEALRLLPAMPVAPWNQQVLQTTAAMLNNLAWELATACRPENRDAAHAVQFAERACELTRYQSAALLETLAAAYAEAGRFPEAVSAGEKACTLAGASGDQVLLRKTRERLEKYRAGQPYHEPAAPTPQDTPAP
jgi:protein O-mannosyl-transferase